MEQVAVRRLAEGDSLIELTELLHRAYAGLAEQGMHYVASHQSEEQTAERIADGECFVALLAERLVGTITLEGSKDDCPYYARPGVISFHQFAVDPPFAKQGIGSKLLGVVEARAQALGARELALDTASGAADLIAMYERRDYRIVDQVDWSDTNYISVIMAKSLGASS